MLNTIKHPKVHNWKCCGSDRQLRKLMKCINNSRIQCNNRKRRRRRTKVGKKMSEIRVKWLPIHLHHDLDIVNDRQYDTVMHVVNRSSATYALYTRFVGLSDCALECIICIARDKRRFIKFNDSNLSNDRYARSHAKIIKTKNKCNA